MIINDIVYGKIELNGIYEQIANCSDFTRLQDITQTAMATIDYPELEKETRYEHSIGVYHLMSRTLNILEKKLSAQGIYFNKEEKEMAKLAALLHDIGHGVHSHLLEKITGLSHEERSIAIIEDKTTQIHQIISEQYGEEFVAKLVKFMKCIYGQETVPKDIEIRQDHTVPLQGVLASLISNNIDLDRLDYLVRESSYTGLGRLTNHEELMKSLECILLGNKITIGMPKEKMYLAETNIFERTRNYDKIYFCNSDFTGDHAFEELLCELNKHPEEVPEEITPTIRKFLTQSKAEFTNKEYMQLTNTPLKETIEVIAKTTKSEKIKYLCDYRRNAKKDYQLLYAGKSEAYVRKLLKMAIPESPEDSHCLFRETRKITPYKKTKFGSMNIITENGIEKFEDLPHAVSLEPMQKTVMAINPEILRLEMGLSKQEFEEKYANTIQDLIANVSRPKEEFELRYIIPSGEVYSGDILDVLETKYSIQDKAKYFSKDTYYDFWKDFSLLEQGKCLRIRNGQTWYNGVRTRNYKNRRISYKTYVEQGEQTYTTRRREEEIGTSDQIEDYEEFLQNIGISKDVNSVLEVDNMRRLVTFLVNGNPIDVSFNIATYQNYIYEMPGSISTIEITPRNNQVLSRASLLEIKEFLEIAFPQLRNLISNANIYEIGMADSYERYCKGYIQSDDGDEFEKKNPEAVQKLKTIIERLKQKRGITQVKEILPVEEFVKRTQTEVEVEEL